MAITKYVIAFSGGRKSVELVNRYLDSKPLLVYCHQEEYPSIHPNVISGYAKSLDLKTKLIAHRLTQPSTDWQEDWYIDGDYAYAYRNTLTDHYDWRKQGILLIGRRKIDLVNAGFRPSEIAIIEKKILPKIRKQIQFPLWDDNDLHCKRLC